MKQQNVIFIWVPKTAGTSIFYALRQYNMKVCFDIEMVQKTFSGRGWFSFCHLNLDALVENGYVETPFVEKAFKFMFTRNPYARFLSLYRYLKRENKGCKSMIPPDCSIEDFARGVCRGDVWPVGLENSAGFVQANPQSDWVPKGGVDFIGEYEYIKDDFNKVCELLGIPPTPLPEMNSTLKFAGDYITPWVKSFIEEFYKKDFELFGYEYD